LSVCAGNFYEIVKWYNHNTYVKYTYNIMQDTRTFSKYYKYKKTLWGPCVKCREKYRHILSCSNINNTPFQYKNLKVHYDNKEFFEFYQKKMINKAI